jgi:2-oxoglutarate dehydrogenase E1 component
MPPSLRELLASTPLSGGNASYVEALYEQFLTDPQSVDGKWREYFLKLKDGSAGEQIHSTVQAGIIQRATRPRMAAMPSQPATEAAAKQGAVSRLVQIYANRGHLIANLDPLGIQKRPRPRVLELGYFGLSEADLDTEYLTDRARRNWRRASSCAKSSAARTRVLQHHWRRVRARLGYRRAPVAAGSIRWAD